MADFFGDMYPDLFGEKKNSPGFISDVKRGTGQVVSAFGSTLQDLGAEDVGSDIEAYGEKVVRRNPSQINTVEEAISSPFTTAREAVGEVVPQVGTALGFGLGGRVIGGALGSLAGPAGTVVGQQVGGVAGAYLGNLAQSYGGIRAEQRESGDNDIARAIGAGATSAFLDTALGAERVATKVLGKGTSFIARESGEKLLPHVAKQFGRGFAEEAGTEAVQTGIERFGAFKDLTSDEALNEYGLAAIKGGFGGGAIRGGLSTVAGERRDGSLLTDANMDTTIGGNTEADAITKAINPGANLNTIDLVNQNANVRSVDKDEQKQRRADVVAALNEPSGQRVTDPETGLERELTAYEAQQLQLGNPVERAVKQATTAVGQAEQQEAKAGEDLAKIGFVFGASTNEKGITDVAGKRLYGPQQTRVFMSELNKALEGRSQLDIALAGAAVKSGLAKITDTGNVKQLVGKIGKVLDTYQVGAVETPEQAAEILNDQISRLEGASALKEADKINSLYASLTGQVAPAYASLQQQLEQTQKGKQDERLQLQSNAGLRTVSEQGGTTQVDGGRPGLLQPSSVQPVQPGSVAQGQTSKQVGAVPAGRVRASTDVSTTGGPSVQGGQDARQGKGQGQVNVSQVTAQTGRGSVPDQTATRDGTSEETVEETAEGIVKQVVNSIIDAVVVRKGRMKKADLAKFKDFIYYDFFQIENKKEGKDGLSKKELAQMFEVTPDTIDGWQKNAAAFFEENRGVIQQKILEALAQNNLTLDDLMDAVKARRDKVESEAVILEEGQSLSEVEREDEEAAKSEVKEVAATDQELGTEEGVLDERDLAGDNVGMSVNQGRVQGSIQEQGKPEETINARIKRKLEQYNEAVAEGDEELEAQLMADIDELTKEAKKVADKQIAKAEALAPKKKAAEPKKRKKVKDAIQEPSAEKVPVREGAGSSEGVRKEDTEKREVAVKGKTELVTQEQKEVAAWNDLPVPIQYEQLSPQAKADWSVSVKNGKTNLAAANAVYEENIESIQGQIADDSKTIDGKDLITEVGEERQIQLLTDQTSKLSNAQTARLEKHYGAKRNSPEFIQKLKEDVLNYVNKGAEAVAGAIRDIVKQIANGVMAVAVVFNPQFMGQQTTVVFPTVTTEIVQAKVPTSVETRMSESGKKAYATLLPTLQKEMKEQNKYFTIVDKPTSTVFVFNPDGTLMDARFVVLGKAMGDFYVGKTDFAQNRITPAGLFKVAAEKGSATYDGKTVYTVGNVAEGWNAVFMHPVYLKESDAKARINALATGKNTRLSYGCINGPLDFMAKIDNEQMNNSHVFIVPDNQKAVDDFIANKVSNEDLTRVTITPATKNVPGKTTIKMAGQVIVGKEETIAVTVDNKAKTPTTRIFANRAIKLFSDLRRLITREQYDVLSNLDYQKVVLDSEANQTVELAFVTLQDLAKFPSIAKGLQALKASPQALLAVDKFAIFKNEGAFEGSDGIQTTYIDDAGNVRVVVGMNEAGFLSRTDEEITHTFVHEVGHGVDLPGYEAGVYSSQPEFRKGGMVREELTKLYKSDEDFAFLAYPLSTKQDEDVTRGELFAQAWAAYLNPDFRAVMQKKAPQTAKYMEDVLNDVKTTTFSRGTPEATSGEIKQKAKLFANYRGQRLASAKGDVKINLTPAEKRYVNSDEFQEDVSQFAQDEGFQEELLLNDDYFDIDNKANQLTIPESMVPAMRKFFDWLVYSEAGYLGKIPPRFRSGRTFFNKGQSPVLDNMRRKGQARIDRMPPAYRNTAQKLYDFLVGRNLSDRLIATFAFTQDVVARAVNRGLTSAAVYKRLDDARKEVLARWSVQVEDTLKDFNKLKPQLQGTGENTVNRFLKDSTMEGKWGFKPEWLKEDVVVDPVMAARFEALGKVDPLAQKVIKDVFKFNYQVNEAMKKVVLENTSTEFDALIKQAQEQNNDKEVKTLQKQKASSLREYQTLLSINAKKPYASLKRFGDIVVVAKSQDFLDAEKDKDFKKMKELETQEKHYVVRFFESNSEAQKAYRDMESMGYAYLTKPFDSADASEANIYGGRDLNGLFYRLRNMANSDKNDKASLGLNKLLNDLHLRLLSEQSARQSENRRRNITGADDDMMRSFASQGKASAHFLSSLHNSGKIYDALMAMRKERDKDPQTKDITSVYYNEIMARHGLNLVYNPTPVVDAALTVTSTWMLLTSPAYYLQNATQPWLLSLPYMSARYKNASSTLFDAYKDISSVVGKTGITQAEYEKLPADVRGAIEELVNRGAINISLSSEIGRFRSSIGQTKDVFEKAGNAYSKATDFLRGTAENLESINRVATAVAAYRLAVKEGKLSADKAIDYAEEVINNTHGDYSNTNAPRFMRTGLGRIATQFRKFQLIQISLLARMWKDWRTNADPKVRQIAKRQLMFTLGHTFAVGGMMGLPGFTAISTIAGALFGDEDEPDNPELFLREMIGDPMLADLLVKGVPAALGVDLSGKLGMGQMLSVLPYTDLKMTKESYQEATLALFGGPFAGGLAPRVVNGLSYMAAGDYYKGIEQLLPKGLSDAAKGVRLATEGVTDKRGDVLLSADEVNFLEATLTGLGLPTTDITKQQFKRGVQIEAEKFYSERTTEMKREYAKAAADNDTQRMSELRKEWMDVQEKRKQYGQPRQPLSDLLKARTEQLKRQAKNIGGVQYTGNNRGLAERLNKI